MVIASMRVQGASMRAIARMLARPPSTVSRELTRNTCPETGYTSETVWKSRSWPIQAWWFVSCENPNMYVAIRVASQRRVLASTPICWGDLSGQFPSE